MKSDQRSAWISLMKRAIILMLKAFFYFFLRVWILENLQFGWMPDTCRSYFSPSKLHSGMLWAQNQIWQTHIVMIPDLRSPNPKNSLVSKFAISAQFVMFFFSIHKLVMYSLSFVQPKKHYTKTKIIHRAQHQDIRIVLLFKLRLQFQSWTPFV